MCLVNIRGTQRGGIKITVDFPPWSHTVNAVFLATKQLESQLAPKFFSESRALNFLLSCFKDHAMCLVYMRSNQKGGVKITLYFPPWSLSMNHFVRLSIHKFFTGSLNVTTKSFPLIVNIFGGFLIDLTFEMPDKWTVFLPVGSVLSHFPHRSLGFLDSFRTRTGVSSVMFVWFFSRSTSLETVYPFDYLVFGQRTDCEVFESKSYNETVAESFNRFLRFSTIFRR